MRFLVVIAVATTLFACGGHKPIPKNGIVEADVGGWRYARYQPLLDIEVWVANNPAKAYAASYTSKRGTTRGQLGDDDIVNVLVTRYAKQDGIVRETVKLARRLAAEKGYQVEEGKIEGARTLTIKGTNETWVMWPSKLHVVKIGGVGRTDVPDSFVAEYADRYPSLLPGGSLEGALPPGPEDPKPTEKPAYDPDNPTPDIEKYDPNKVKLP